MSTISTETRQLVDELVASGRFESGEAVIEQAVRLLRDELQPSGQESSMDVSAEEWCARFEAWAANHRGLSHEADDSREAVYEGRGE